MGLWSLLKVALIAILAWWLYRGIRGLVSGQTGRSRMEPGPDPDREVLDVMVQDPQCGTYLPKNEALRHWSKGKEYFFCSKKCRDDFRAGVEPEDSSR